MSGSTSMSESPEQSAYSKDNPFPAVVTENRVLNRPGSAKETRHIVVSIAGSGLHYKSGDSVGVFPTNRPEEVAAIQALLGAKGSETVTLPKAPAPVTLREALFSRLALAGPTRKMVEALAAKATAPAEKAKLEGLLAPESKEVLASWLVDREFVDLLAEFPSARFQPQELVDHMRRLMPRLYSIASSAVVHPSEVHLTVAIVRYTTNGRDRVGVCTTFLSDRAEVARTPTPVFISHSHFGLPEDGARDVIMVGPGTGIAPFRAFLQERAAKGATGRNWLFFGDQKRATDFLYEEDWEGWKKSGVLTRDGHGLFPGPIDEGLRAGPHEGERRGAAGLDQGRGEFLRLRRREADGEGRRPRAPRGAVRGRNDDGGGCRLH